MILQLGFLQIKNPNWRGGGNSLRSCSAVLVLQYGKLQHSSLHTAQSWFCELHVRQPSDQILQLSTFCDYLWHNFCHQKCRHTVCVQPNFCDFVNGLRTVQAVLQYTYIYCCRPLTNDTASKVFPFEPTTILNGPCIFSWAASAFLKGVGVLGVWTIIFLWSFGVLKLWRQKLY